MPSPSVEAAEGAFRRDAIGPAPPEGRKLAPPAAAPPSPATAAGFMDDEGLPARAAGGRDGCVEGTGRGARARVAEAALCAW